MSAAGEVRAAAARLRAAGVALAALPRGERIAALGALLERLRDPTSAIRSRLASELPAATGFHATTLAAGLDAGFAPWTARAFADLVESELGTTSPRIASGFPLTAVVLGGAIPMPSVLQMLAPLALGSPVLVRPGAHDLVTAPAIASALGEIAPALGRSVEVVSFPHGDGEAMAALAEAECVVATGSDAAVAAVRALTRPWQRFVGYGHRFSVAAIERGADLPAACAAVARDTALWDQAGCLSPVALYAVGWRWADRAELLSELERAFAQRALQWPLAKLEGAHTAARAHEIATSEMRGAGASSADVRRDPANQWALLAERESEFRGSPLGRVLRVHFVRSFEAMVEALRPVARHLASIGLAGRAALGAPPPLLALRPSRICRLGEMQAPPISWCHDGQGVLVPLAALISTRDA